MHTLLEIPMAITVVQRNGAGFNLKGKCVTFSYCSDSGITYKRGWTGDYESCIELIPIGRIFCGSSYSIDFRNRTLP